MITTPASSILPQARRTMPPRPIIEELLQDTELTNFLNAYFGKEPYAAPHAARRFKGLIDWQLIAEILIFDHRDCWLPKQGRPPKDPEFMSGQLTIKQAVTSFAEGRTVLVRHAEKAHSRIKAIAEDFERFFQRAVDVQLYCTPAGAEGFDWHYDIEDVFVIQSQGKKEFRLLRNKRVPPLPHVALPPEIDLAAESVGQEIRCLLHPGDWLYIPAGFWHKARAVDESSFHLSVGVMPPAARLKN